MAKGEARYRLSAETKPFEDALKGAQKQFEEFGATLLKGFGLGGGFAIGEKAAEALVDAFKEVPKAMVEVVEHVVEYGHSVEIAAAKTGLTVETIQKLSVAAKLTGTSLESMTGLVGKMEKAIGNGSAAFAQMGLDLSKLKTSSPDEALRIVIERLGQIKNPIQQAAAGAAVFGKAWQEAAAIINDPEVLNSASRLGAVLGKEDVEAAAEMARAGNELSIAWEAVQNQFAAAITSNPQLMAALKGAVDAMADLAHWARENRGAIGGVVDMLVGAGVSAVTGFKMLAEWAGKALDTLLLFRGAIPGLTDALKVIKDISTYLHMQNESALNAEAVRLAKAALAPKQGGGGPGYDPKAAEAAAKAQEAWQKSAEKARVEWDKFYEHLDTGSSNAFHSMQQDIDKYVDHVIKEQTRAGEAYIAALAKGRQAEFDEMEYASKVDEQLAAARQRRNEDFVGSLRQIASAIGQVGGTMGHFLADSLNVFANLKDQGLRAASVWQKVAIAIQGAVAAYQAGQQAGSKGKGALAGAGQGAAAGAAFGWVGAAVGGVVGGVLGFFGGKSAEKKQLADLNTQLATLQQQAHKAGIQLQIAFDPKNALSMKNAIAQVQQQMDAHQQSQEALNAAVERYGFTIDELGPAMARQKLDEQAGQLYQDWQVLNAAGIDHEAIIKRMGPAVNDYVNAAVHAGQEIPAAMKPIIDDMIAHHQLLDENGNAYGSSEEAGIHYAKTMSEMFEDLIKHVEDLVAAITGIPDKTTTVTVHRKIVDDDGGGGDDGGRTPGMASGGFVPARPGGSLRILGEGGEGEWVIPNSRMKRIISGGGDPALAAEMRGLRRDLRASNHALPKLIRDAVLLGR